VESRQLYGFYMLMGALIAAHAVHWFVGGESVGASELRTVAVVGQLVAGVALTLWAWTRRRKQTPPVT
jgi:hypothetical protein